MRSETLAGASLTRAFAAWTLAAIGYLRELTLNTLIDWYWIVGEGAALGMKVTDSCRKGSSPLPASSTRAQKPRGTRTDYRLRLGSPGAGWAAAVPGPSARQPSADPLGSAVGGWR